MAKADILKPDTFYLYIFPRKFHAYIPNMSPFGMKVETWLRLNNVKYEVSVDRREVSCMQLIEL